MEDKNKLTKTQMELLMIKRMNVERAHAELQQLGNQIALELGIKQEELQGWKLSKDGEYLERFKQPQMKIPKGKK